MGQAALESQPLKMIRNDRLLSVGDVEEITGFCRRVSQELMVETGQLIEIRGRRFVFESVFLDFLDNHKCSGDGDA